MEVKHNSLQPIQTLSLPPDMGEAQSDGSLQPIRSQVPSLKTTRLIESDMPMIDLVLHIGDISYARGYAGVVGQYEK